MNEFTIFNGTIWFSDADSVYKHLYPECGFEVESLGVSDRFVSEDAFIAQRNLKDEYMRRDMKHSETISELRKQIEEKQDYIKNLEERIASQRTANKSVESQKLDAQLRCGIYREDIEARDAEIAMLETHNENQRKELKNLNKVLEKERKRNKELEELYSRAQSDVSMLNMKVMELNQGIRNSADLTWKEKYDELENENKVLKARLKEAIGIDYTDSTDYIAQLHKNVLNQRKELANLNKVLEKERKRNKELEELYSGAQKDVSMLNLKVMELNQGIRDSADLTWKEKYDELETKYTEDSKALNGVINELRKRLNQRDYKIEVLETGIKELSESKSDLDKKIRSLENDENYTTRLKDRCSKAERTIDAIKEALIDGNYIHRIDLRGNEK